MKKEKKAIIELLKKRSDIIFAYLFGSKAKGYADERSDWDIAAYFKEPFEKRGDWLEFMLEAELSRAVGATVQVTVLNAPLPPVFGFEIIKNAIIMLDREPNLRMDFEIRMMRQYYDWQYFLKRQMEADRHRSRT